MMTSEDIKKYTEFLFYNFSNHNGIFFSLYVEIILLIILRNVIKTKTFYLQPICGYYTAS